MSQQGRAMLVQARTWRVPVLLWVAWSSGAQAVQGGLPAPGPAALTASVDVHIARSRPDDLPLARAMAERCVTLNPASSLCAEALGNVLMAQRSAARAAWSKPSVMRAPFARLTSAPSGSTR